MKLTLVLLYKYYLNSFLPSNGHMFSTFNLITPIISKIDYFYQFLTILNYKPRANNTSDKPVDI